MCRTLIQHANWFIISYSQIKISIKLSLAFNQIDYFNVKNLLRFRNLIWFNFTHACIHQMVFALLFFDHLNFARKRKKRQGVKCVQQSDFNLRCLCNADKCWIMDLKIEKDGLAFLSAKQWQMTLRLLISVGGFALLWRQYKIFFKKSAA